MSDEIVIVTPEIAPGCGGVADYTLRLVEHLNAPNARFLVPATAGSQNITSNSQVELVVPRAKALLAKLPASGGKVLVQYSAYGFDRFGYPAWLINALLDWKRNSHGLLVVMFHEIWAFWPVLNKNYVLQWLHRRKIRQLLTVADAVLTSTKSQAEHLAAVSSNKIAIEVVPVGSNISCAASPNSIRDQALAVLFGLQGARIRTLQSMREDLGLIAAARKILKIVTFGAGGTTQGDRHERSLLSDLRLADGFEQRGPLAEEQVSRLLLSAPFALSGLDPLSLSKSCSFMACAAHGVNVISPVAGLTEDEPACWLVSPKELIAGLSEIELDARAQHLREWQERTGSWPQIANKFRAALQFENSGRREPLSICGKDQDITR